MSNLLQTIISSLVTGSIALVGILIANGKNQAVTDTKLEMLTREVHEHNNFAHRMPVVEEQITTINHRIKDIERELERIRENERKTCKTD